MRAETTPQVVRDTVGIDAFVNADVIAQGLSGFRPASAAFEAGRVMLRRLDELAADGEDFAFESTLSGRSAHNLLTRLDRRGYEVHIFYLWLPSADLAVERVRGRVEVGGHDVPESVIRRRFSKSVVNFDRLYRPLATTWRLFDGSALDDRPLIAHSAKGADPVVLDHERWVQVRAQAEEDV